MQINIAIDELFSNIAHYAYNPETGDATVRVEVIEDPMAVIITFIDNGVPYDPLKQKDPDTTLPAEERELGGLGIYMVKKTMDDITYEYKDGKNILSIKKHLK
jgi:anti-sigma regulatory factor (Ser/Thr protein kinase)